MSDAGATKATGEGPAHSKHFTGIGLLVVATVALGAGMVWWMCREPLPRATASPTIAETQPLSSPDAASAAATGRTTSSEEEVEIATILELEKTCSAKKFTFRKPFTSEKVPAIVIRLPNGPTDRETSYRALALEAPFAHCELEYVADLGKLSSQYSFRAPTPWWATRAAPFTTRWG